MKACIIFHLLLCFIVGIPSFVIIDESHKVITLNGRAAVFADPEGKVM